MPVEEPVQDNTPNGTEPTVVRTHRGLTVAGTRLTLYQIMEYLEAGWPPEQIQYLHRLTDDQMTEILEYIDSHRAEVEAEYHLVLRRAEENRRYWEERNRERPLETDSLPTRSDHHELRAKMDEWKQRLSHQS